MSSYSTTGSLQRNSRRNQCNIQTSASTRTRSVAAASPRINSTSLSSQYQCNSNVDQRSRVTFATLDVSKSSRLSTSSSVNMVKKNYLHSSYSSLPQPNQSLPDRFAATMATTSGWRGSGSRSNLSGNVA